MLPEILFPFVAQFCGKIRSVGLGNVIPQLLRRITSGVGKAQSQSIHFIFTQHGGILHRKVVGVLVFLDAEVEVCQSWGGSGQAHSDIRGIIESAEGLFEDFSCFGESIFFSKSLRKKTCDTDIPHRGWEGMDDVIEVLGLSKSLVRLVCLK